MEAGGPGGVAFVLPRVLAKNLALFNPIRHLFYRSVDLLDLPLIGKRKSESTKVLRINSKIPHFWGFNCHLCLCVEQGAVINRNRKPLKTWAIWKQSPKVTCQTPGAQCWQINTLMVGGAWEHEFLHAGEERGAIHKPFSIAFIIRELFIGYFINSRQYIKSWENRGAVLLPSSICVVERGDSKMTTW